MIQLLASPERYDRRPVRTIGFCRLEFEGTALYFHREDYEQGISKHGIWLDLGWPVPVKYADRKGKYVIVEGTFSASEHGHFHMYGGSIKDISRLDEWHSPKSVAPPPKPN